MWIWKFQWVGCCHESTDQLRLTSSTALVAWFMQRLTNTASTSMEFCASRNAACAVSPRRSAMAACLNRLCQTTKGSSEVFKNRRTTAATTGVDMVHASKSQRIGQRRKSTPRVATLLPRRPPAFSGFAAKSLMRNSLLPHVVTCTISCSQINGVCTSPHVPTPLWRTTNHGTNNPPIGPSA